MKFIDVSREYNHFKKEIDARWEKVQKSGIYLFGKETEELEENMKRISGKQNAVVVGNCTDAITMVLRSVLDKLPKNTPVVLPDFGAYPTAVAAKSVTNNIYYAPIDDNFCLKGGSIPDFKNQVIIPVDLFGNKCYYFHPNAKGSIIIEDMAQSAGLKCTGDYGVYSFYPTKNLASIGDGGCIVSDLDLSEFKRLRFYGQKNGMIKEVGVNSRMDEFQAAVVNSKAGRLDWMNAKRQKIAYQYNEIAGNMFSESVYHQYPILFKDREKVIGIANKMGVPTIIHYPHHYPDMPALRGVRNLVERRVSDKILSVPINPWMTEKEVDLVYKFLKEVKIYECY